jgi:purine-binding chemotaxis protein CheW
MGMPTEDQFLEGLVAIENRMVTLVSLAGLFGMSAGSTKRTATDSDSTIAA